MKLTIDQSLQYVAQHYLDTAVPESGARGAQMAVLDVHTGQVLALASSGTFDAADPETIDPNRPIDPPVMSAFEPGSVQKAITFAAALHEKAVTPQTVYPRARLDPDGWGDGQRRLVARHAGLHRDRRPRRVVQRGHAQDRPEARARTTGTATSSCSASAPDRHRAAR